MDIHYKMIKEKVISNNIVFVDNFFEKNKHIKFYNLKEFFINELEKDNIFYIYNFLKIFENFIENNKLNDEILKFWIENFQYNINKYNDKNGIINLIYKINKKISYFSNNIKSFNNRNNNKSFSLRKSFRVEKLKNIKPSPSKQLISPYVNINKEETEIYNIITINNEIKFISIDLFLIKIMEGKFSENYLEKFIKQSFQFISYDILIKKIFYLFEKLGENKNIFLKNFFNLIINFISDKQENEIFNFKLSDEILSKIKFQKIPRINFNLEINPIDKETIINFNLLEIPPKIFALILTNYTNSLFIELKTDYYQLNPFCLKRKNVYSPIINKLINLTNNIVRFFIEEIISYDSKKKRTLVIKQITEIAKSLYEFHNLNDLYAIANMYYTIEANLRNSFILDENSLDFVNFSKNLCSPISNNLNIKKEITRLKNEKLNFTQVLNLTLSIIYNKDDTKYINNGLINIKKIDEIDEIIFNLIDNLKYCKIYKVENQYKNYENIINIFLTNLKPKELDNLIDYCSKLEPEFKLPKKNETKRMTETQSYILKKYKNIII